MCCFIGCFFLLVASTAALHILVPWYLERPRARLAGLFSAPGDGRSPNHRGIDREGGPQGLAMINCFRDSLQGGPHVNGLGFRGFGL